jgi:NitT/TauT family transport system ATP-binding protein
MDDPVDRRATNTPAVKIAVHGLTKQFGEGENAVTPFRDLDFEVLEGEFVCIVGPSGVGKTTLLHVIAGLEKATTGQVLVSGAPVEGPGPDRAVVYQEDAVFPWFTVEQNLAYGPRARGWPKDRTRQEVERYLKVVGLERFRTFFPRQLSGGMKKRVDLARNFVNDPDIVLMDEPFGGLDVMTKQTLQEETLTIWESNHKTILFVTHDLEEAIFLADRVFILATSTDLHQYGNVLPRPRTPDMRTSDEAQEYRRELSQVISRKRRL